MLEGSFRAVGSEKGEKKKILVVSDLGFLILNISLE